MAASEIRQRGAVLWGFVQHPVSSPRKSHTQLYTFQCTGPMARSVSDIALRWQVVLATTIGIPWLTHATSETFLKIKPANLKDVRVAWTEDFGGVAPLDEGIRGCFKKSSAPLRTHFNLLVVVTQIFPMLGIVFGHYVASIIWLATDAL